MAQLRTDYKDDLLDTSVNTQRKYRQVNNGDGTVSFVDVTEYSQQGDPFGAGDINAITGNLTADNGESFNFGYNSEKKEYGFWAKVEGADTFIPFSQKDFDFFRDCGQFVTNGVAPQMELILYPYTDGTDAKYLSHSTPLKDLSKVTIKWKNMWTGSSNSASTMTYTVGIGTTQNSFVDGKSQVKTIKPYSVGQNWNESQEASFDLSDLNNDFYIVLSIKSSSKDFASNSHATIVIESVDFE